MTGVVGVIAQGTMGAGVGGRLADHGFKVLTVLEGRSAASEKRATAFGMTPASWKEVADVDLFISLVPPSEALTLAKKLAPHFKAAKRKPIYADLNAISPQTAISVGEIVTEAGCVFADGGVCGPPPKKGGKDSPVIYTSGPGAKAFGGYKKHGLDIREMDAPIGAASAVKICQAGFTKGYTALASMVALAAMRFGAGETLRQELLDTRMGLMEFLNPAAYRMFDKAYRYVGEMDEISEFLSNETGGKQVFDAFSDLYTKLAEDNNGPKHEVELLKKFYGPEVKDQ